MYKIQVLEGMEVGPQSTTLKNIYLTKARIYPKIIPQKHKKYLEFLNYIYKLNFIIFAVSSIVLLGHRKRTPETFKKITFMTGLFYFSFLFLDWRMRNVYIYSYMELRKTKSEEEIIKMINAVSTKTKIIV